MALALNPARDFQLEVYRWERTVGIIPLDEDGAYLSKPQCRVFIDRCWHELGRPGETPRIVFVREPGEDAATHLYDNDLFLIVLPPWARTKGTMLHELAHVLNEIEEPSHGRPFVETYIDLLSRFGGYDFDWLIESAKKFGIFLGNA